jgi:Uma2 family endonuclease
MVDGAPVLAIEILSPYDKHKEIVKKVRMYLKHGVKLVWVVDPGMRTVTIYRPDAPPQLHNESNEITADPYLPGFGVPVRDIFAR